MAQVNGRRLVTVTSGIAAAAGNGVDSKRGGGVVEMPRVGRTQQRQRRLSGEW